MAFTYPTAIREAACKRLLEGERPVKKQALIDAGRRPGLKSHEPDELARARRRIKDLEAELELVKAASALFNGEEVVRPKGSARSFES
jgi:hypothetical protein